MSTIGVKIRKLRDSKKMSQKELALKIGIEQTTLGSIESGNTKKIDFLLMNKICNEFDVDFDYFLDDKTTNKVKENNGGVVGCNNGTINNIPIDILQTIIKRIDEIEKKITDKF